MRKTIVLLIMLLLCLQPVSAFAASAPEILNEPQNLVWPENSVACCSVEAYGDDLSYKWYIICDEVTYDTTIFEEGLPWIGFGMSGCGASADGKTFYINGITNEANGAQIFCEVTNGAGSVRSRAATISVGGSALPPNIKVVPGIIVEMNRPASITEFASVHNVDCIVFEHLDMQGAKRGKKKQKLALWRKNTIQAVVAHKAHRLGIRISHICAWKTSKLAFDGSGEVERSKDNYSLCTFKTGKRYNCDLNASYNIGARYFIRELLKPLPATERSRIGAKVPGIELRTSNTLSTLKALSAELCAA